MSAADVLDMRALALALLPHLRELGFVPASGAVDAYDRTRLPPGFRSVEAFAAECRRLRLDPETYRPGRSWTVDCATWERARREDKAKRRKVPQRYEGDDVDAMLERSGLRLLRGTR